MADGGLPGLVGQTWSIVSGKLINTPTTTGNELVTNGGFDSATTGWSAISSAVLSSVAGGQSGNCLEVKNGAAANGSARQQLLTAIDSWYLGSVYHKSGTGNGRIYVGSTASGTDLFDSGTITDASFAKKVFSVRAKTTDTYLRLFNGSSTVDITTLYDTATVFQLLLSTLFAWRKFATQYGIVKAGCNVVAGTPEGVYMNLDNPSNPANMVTCLHNGTNLVLSKRVNGTVTELISTAATYVAGALVEIRRAVNTNTYQAFYNGSQVGVDQTISDASIINNKIHGLMGTHQQNQVLNFTFTGA